MYFKKYNFFKAMFPGLIKNKKFAKLQRKAFMIISDNPKLNWILGSKIIDSAYSQFDLTPMTFVTNNLGFTSVDEVGEIINPHNPMCFMFTDSTISEEKLERQDFGMFKDAINDDYMESLYSLDNVNSIAWFDNLTDFTKNYDLNKGYGKQHALIFLLNTGKDAELIKTVKEYCSKDNCDI